MNIPQFLLAAPTSGSGKTTISRGLMALFTRKGLKVQPFKCGPDYIDTKYHTAVCRRPSVNLDTFMASESHVCKLYACYAADAGVCVVEGMMGMFDGYDRDRGSSAEIARLLHLPVVLVVDAKSAAYSMAPLLWGFLHFRSDVHVAGVIFNRVGSPRHYAMLQEVCADLSIPCLGYLPKRKELEQASRYLGLDFSRKSDDSQLELLTDLLEQHVDWQHLLSLTALPLPDAPVRCPSASEPLRILVARNEESFSFLYQEHLDILNRLGNVYFFDPEENQVLPVEEADLLYLPGGYPEKRAEALSAARDTLSSIRQYVEAGGRTLAECGGMIYLSRGICREEGGVSGGTASFIPLAGVLPLTISERQADRRLSLGYRQFEYAGQFLRGHEFHYTQFLHRAGDDSLPSSVAQVRNARGESVDTPVFRYKNTIASYTHLYWGETKLMDLFG